MIKFEIYRGKGAHPYYWRIKGRNGEILVDSEGFGRRRGPQRAIETIVSAVKSDRFKIVDLSKPEKRPKPRPKFRPDCKIRPEEDGR